jgi:hypothetical protein
MPSGTFLQKILKILSGLTVAFVLLLVFVVTSSSVESRFECSGSATSDGNSQLLRLHMKLNEYRWWVGLWSDSDGDIWIEVSNQTFEYINHINEVGDQLQLFDNDFRGKKEVRGHFSNLSKYLSVRIARIGFFDGICKKIQ